jgi:hypothetical protein
MPMLTWHACADRRNTEKHGADRTLGRQASLGAVVVDCPALVVRLVFVHERELARAVNCRPNALRPRRSGIACAIRSDRRAIALGVATAASEGWQLAKVHRHIRARKWGR